jgi:hypothetical protein
MIWKRKKQKAEIVPWYRSPGYKGNLTEAEKRKLDAFRMQPKHPAARNEDLPEEVQSYINRLEMEIYDFKQDKTAAQAFGLSLFGCASLYLSYYGLPSSSSPWPYAGGLLLLVIPWFVYAYQWRKNAKAFRGVLATDEAIRFEWELDHNFYNKRDEDDLRPS